MARCAIVGYGLAVGAGMRTIVTAETAGEVVVTEVVGMNAPAHIHVGEDVAEIDLRGSRGGLFDEGALGVVNVRISRAVITREVLYDTGLGRIAIRLGGFKEFDSLLSREGQLRADEPTRHSQIDGIFR